ncbi:MAG: hypothetical protein GC136_03135 [Alphaproteobacteria bacterium]|nr:hypothetical protein [Alphaproteobacteria bacterium]
MSKTNAIAAACCGTASTAVGLAAPHIFCVTNAVLAFTGASVISPETSQNLAIVGISAAAGGLVLAWRQGKNALIMTGASIAAGLILSAGFNEITGRHHRVVPEGAICTDEQNSEAAQLGVDCTTYLGMCRNGQIPATP